MGDTPLGPKPIPPSDLQKFLVKLKETCNVTKSAESIGKTRQTLYNYKEANEAFSADWDNYLKEGVDGLEYIAQEHAFKGIKKKVFYKGEAVDTELEYSDGMKKFLLMAHNREKFGGLNDVDVKVTAGVLLVPQGMTMEEWEKQHKDNLSDSV